MSLFDWFEPDPPLLCLKCGKGFLRSWQEKPGTSKLFRWQQGVAAPIDQVVDEECQISPEGRSSHRLPKDENLEIYYGECELCHSTSPYSLPLAFTDDTWTRFAEGKQLKYGDEIEPGWLQCPACMDAYELRCGAFMVACHRCGWVLLKSQT